MFEKEDFDKYMKDSEDYYDNREPMTERKLYQLWKDGAEFGFNKANEWHDLEKNPNDLPKDKRYVWCDYGDGYGKGFYDKDDGGWWIEGHIYCSIIDAWCELPKRN